MDKTLLFKEFVSPFPTAHSPIAPMPEKKYWAAVLIKDGGDIVEGWDIPSGFGIKILGIFNGKNDPRIEQELEKLQE